MILVLLQIRCPAAAPAPEMTAGVMTWMDAGRGQTKPQKDPDPAYGTYQRYRYAYDTYGYLFLSGRKNGEESGAEAAEGAVSMMGAALGAGTGTEAEAGVGMGTGMGAETGAEVGTGAGMGKESGTGAGSGAGMGAEPAPGAGASAALGTLPAAAVTMQKLQDYDYLLRHFYSIHPSTTADRNLMQADQLLGTDLRLNQDPSVPQILIYHTHSQETYADYGPGNLSSNVVENGTRLAELLTAKGWNVIHDTSSYDMQSGELDRSRAYNYALDGITGILQKYPTIEVILDLHRDGVREGLRLVQESDRGPTANLMFFQGMSRTPEGAIEYLPNPYLKENLAFTFQMQLAAESRYPGLTRKIYLKGLRYNLHLRPRSALIEVGAQTNTGEEARRAMEPLAELLDMVLQGN